MITKLKNFIINFIKKPFISIKRFPLTIILAIIASAFFIYLNHLDNNYEKTKNLIELLYRIALIISLSALLSLCLKMIFERKFINNKMAITAIYFTSVLGMFFYFKFLLKDFTMVSTTRYTGICIILILLFLYIPYLLRKENFELYTINVLTRFFITYIYSIVLFIGITGMLTTINALFNANISERYYLDILILVIGVFAVTFFLADIPKQEIEFKLVKYPIALKVLLLYIVIPLIYTYSLILYAYFGKIIITQNWPIGLVSHLVLWYTTISIFLIFFIYPLNNTNKFAKFFIRIFPKISLPLLIMMFISIGIRINAYGITENRYYILVLGFWVTCCMLYFNIIKKPKNILILVSLSIIIIISVFSPISSYSISKLSQNSRFENILHKNNMLKASKIIPTPKKISEKDKREIAEIITYFDNNHSLKDLNYLPKNYSDKNMQKIFGFTKSTNEIYLDYHITDKFEVIKVKNFDYLIRVNSYTENYPLPNKIKISFKNKKNLVIKKGSKIIYKKNIANYIQKININKLNEFTKTEKSLVFTDTNQNLTLRIIFVNIYGNNLNGSTNLESIDFNLLVSFNHK